MELTLLNLIYTLFYCLPMSVFTTFAVSVYGMATIAVTSTVCTFSAVRKTFNFYRYRRAFIDLRFAQAMMYIFVSNAKTSFYMTMLPFWVFWRTINAFLSFHRFKKVHMGKGKYFGPIFLRDREVRKYKRGSRDELSKLVEEALKEAITEEVKRNKNFERLTKGDMTTFTNESAIDREKPYIAQELSKILSLYDQYMVHKEDSTFDGFMPTTLQEAREIGGDEGLCYLINSRVDKASVRYPMYMINNCGSGIGVRWRNRFKYTWFYAALYIYGLYATYVENMNTLRHEIASRCVEGINYYTNWCLIYKDPSEDTTYRPWQFKRDYGKKCNSAYPVYDMSKPIDLAKDHVRPLIWRPCWEPVKPEMPSSSMEGLFMGMFNAWYDTRAVTTPYVYRMEKMDKHNQHSYDPKFEKEFFGQYFVKLACGKALTLNAHPTKIGSGYGAKGKRFEDKYGLVAYTESSPSKPIWRLLRNSGYVVHIEENFNHSHGPRKEDKIDFGCPKSCDPKKEKEEKEEDTEPQSEIITGACYHPVKEDEECVTLVEVIFRGYHAFIRRQRMYTMSSCGLISRVKDDGEDDSLQITDDFTEDERIAVNGQFAPSFWDGRCTKLYKKLLDGEWQSWFDGLMRGNLRYSEYYTIMHFVLAYRWEIFAAMVASIFADVGLTLCLPAFMMYPTILGPFALVYSIFYGVYQFRKEGEDEIRKFLTILAMPSIASVMLAISPFYMAVLCYMFIFRLAYRDVLRMILPRIYLKNTYKYMWNNMCRKTGVLALASTVPADAQKFIPSSL